jgi:hypothetical protein
MAKSKLAGVFAVLIALTLFFGGMLSYKLLAGTGAKALTANTTGQQQALRSEGVGIQGKVAIQVYSASGRLLTNWKGHNQLSPESRFVIAKCLSGATPPSTFVGSCSGPWINEILICTPAVVGGIANCDQAAATNTMPGCGYPPAINSACVGWQSTATIEITVAADYGSAHGRTANLNFDDVLISPSLSLNVGDRAVVTITFTVS